MSNPTGCGAIDLPLVNFTIAEQGPTSGKLVGNAAINSQVAIDGNPDLSKVIVGSSGACVLSITYQSFSGIARKGEVYVFGQGPKGTGSGTLHMTFKMTGGDHTLGLTSSSPECHNDKFEDQSNMIAIEWTCD